METSPTISVVINTLNEEKNLPYAIRSVKSWADEIVVVDMYSDDRTVEIAKEHEAKVFFHKRMGYADPARSFAISKATGNWILILDADELVPQPLSIQLRNIAIEDTADVVSIPWLNYFFGEPLMHTGWGPTQDKHERFFKRGFLETNAIVHRFLQPSPDARILLIPYRPGYGIVHFNYIDVAHFLEKLNRYTTIEAELIYKQNTHSSPLQAIFYGLRGWLRRYIKQQGYKDGWRGFYLSIFWAFYRFTIYAKVQQLTDVGPYTKIVSNYQEEAKKILALYEQHQ